MFSDHVLAAKVRLRFSKPLFVAQLLIEKIVNSTSTLPCQSTPIQPIRSH